MITQTYLHRLLHYDPLTGVFTWRISRPPNIYKGRRAGCIQGAGYRTIGIDGRRYYEHRLAWFYVYGVWPKKNIDHKNRDVGNNAIAELRLASQHQNLGNKVKHKNNTSGYKGVSWHKQRGKWTAWIHIHGKGIYLGLHDTPQQAHAAYVAAAKRYFGAFARAT